MSLTTSLLPTASSSACGFSLYTIPTADAACAIPNKAGSNYTAVMDKCCHGAPVEKYDHDCGLYCLAAGQAIGDLVKCLTSNGVGFSEAFCNKNTTSTATAKISSSAASKTASGTASAKGSGTGTAAASASSTGAAPGAYVERGVSKTSAAILGLLFVSSAFGAFL